MDKQCEHNKAFYYNTINEAGWRCSDICGQELGFRPDLDRKLTWFKVMGILQDLVQNKFISVSNATEGDGITGYVVKKCQEKDVYDQVSILRFILEIDTHHVEYWQEQSHRKISHQIQDDILNKNIKDNEPLSKFINEQETKITAKEFEMIKHPIKNKQNESKLLSF